MWRYVHQHTANMQGISKKCDKIKLEIRGNNKWFERKNITNLIVALLINSSKTVNEEKTAFYANKYFLPTSKHWRHFTNRWYNIMFILYTI